MILQSLDKIGVSDVAGGAGEGSSASVEVR
jgi:hypothetical protein